MLDERDATRVVAIDSVEDVTGLCTCRPADAECVRRSAQCVDRSLVRRRDGAQDGDPHPISISVAAHIPVSSEISAL